MPLLTWNESAWEHLGNAMALYHATGQRPTVEDLKAVRTRLRKAIVELDREIAAGLLRLSEAERNGAGVGLQSKEKGFSGSPAPRPLPFECEDCGSPGGVCRCPVGPTCKYCGDSLDTVTEKSNGICGPCLRDLDEDAAVYGEDE